MKKYRQVRPNLIPFVDYHTNILLVFILILAFSSITKKTADESLSANVVYQLVMDWPGESQSDVDLWAKDPAGHIVGFNNREGGDGSLISLAHDDLGSRNDLANKDKAGEVIRVNQEIISIRGLLPGEYIVNAHDYRHYPNEEPIKVTCKLVKIKPFKEIITKEIILNIAGDEKTFFRFVVDSENNISETNFLEQKIIQQQHQATEEQESN